MQNQWKDEDREPTSLLQKLKAISRLMQAKSSPKVSAKIMANMWQKWPYTIDEAVNKILKDSYPEEYEGEDTVQNKKHRFGGTPQRTYLLDRKYQDQEFQNDGWIRKPSTPYEYGLVKKAVGNRKLPVWQTKEDVVKRSEVIPIGNLVIDSRPYVSEDAELPHPGNYPNVFYIGKDGNFYTAGFDLNDYTGLNPAGKYADIIGSPVVVKTGIQPLDHNIFHYGKEYYPSQEEVFFEGIEPIMDKVPKYDQIMYDTYNLLPEITVTPKKTTYNTKVKLRKK